MSKENKIKYAELWKSSARHFEVNGLYDWMCKFIRKYPKVVEIGCGTGQGTLALLKAGHKVISIDTNEFCIEETKRKIVEMGYTVETSLNKIESSDLVIIRGDITDDILCNKLSKIQPDLFLCWNIGTYWSEEMKVDYLDKMQIYGLTEDQINNNPQTSYSELVIWQTCKVAKISNAAVHLIERMNVIINSNNNHFYELLKKGFNFKNTKYEQIEAKTLSIGGIPLIGIDRVLVPDNEVSIFLTSILMK
ncbi:MAG: methyltransferase domain-containing protein [Saprospiraceae bacterium]|nr:methyltransferase domain-containing protein [Saprospiraceae bacterium]